MWIIPLVWGGHHNEWQWLRLNEVVVRLWLFQRLPIQQVSKTFKYYNWWTKSIRRMKLARSCSTIDQRKRSQNDKFSQLFWQRIGCDSCQLMPRPKLKVLKILRNKLNATFVDLGHQEHRSMIINNLLAYVAMRWFKEKFPPIYGIHMHPVAWIPFLRTIEKFLEKQRSPKRPRT